MEYATHYRPHEDDDYGTDPYGLQSYDDGYGARPALAPPPAPSRPAPRRRPRLSFNPWVFGGSIGFLVFALLYVSIGLRWHTYRARANLYAQEEMELTFKAVEYKRLGSSLGLTDESMRRSLECRSLAEQCARAAEERGRLRKLYEEAW